MQRLTCEIERFKGLGNKYIFVSKFPFITNEFSGKRAIVTGGTAGIGEAITSRLLDGGADVITTSRNSKSDHEERKHLFIEADLSTSEGCTRVINEISSQFEYF